MCAVYKLVAPDATSNAKKFAQSATTLVSRQRMHRRNDHQEPRRGAADVAAHVRLLAIEVNAIAWLHHKGLGADDEFNGAFQQEQHFLAFVLDELGMHFLAGRKGQLE